MCLYSLIKSIHKVGGSQTGVTANSFSLFRSNNTRPFATENWQVYSALKTSRHGRSWNNSTNGVTYSSLNCMQSEIFKTLRVLQCLRHLIILIGSMVVHASKIRVLRNFIVRVKFKTVVEVFSSSRDMLNVYTLQEHFQCRDQGYCNVRIFERNVVKHDLNDRHAYYY